MVKQVINSGDRILILECEHVQLMVVDKNTKSIIFCAHEEDKSPHGEILGQIKPLSKWSLNWYFNSLRSDRAIMYGGINIC